MTLNMSTSSWNPAQTSLYVTLSWNRENSVVSGQSVLEAILTMQVSLNVTAITSFDFSITIAGTECARSLSSFSNSGFVKNDDFF